MRAVKTGSIGKNELNAVVVGEHAHNLSAGGLRFA